MDDSDPIEEDINDKTEFLDTGDCEVAPFWPKIEDAKLLGADEMEDTPD